MKIWKVQFIESNVLKTFIVIAENRVELLECIDREYPNKVSSENMIIGELSTARPSDSKIVYYHADK